MIYWHINYRQPVGTALEGGRGEVPLFSAGHTKHEWTSWAASQAIFADIDRAMEENMDVENNKEKTKEDREKKEEL